MLDYGQGKFQVALPFALDIITPHKNEFDVDYPTSAILRVNVGEPYVEIGA